MKNKILISLALLLGVQNSYAQDCATTLVDGKATSAGQASVFCGTFNSAITGSLVPKTSNEIDLGSSTKNFQNLYLGEVLDLSFEVVAGAGTTVADAAALSATKIVHQITGANGTVGWKFPTTTNVGTVHVLLNTTAGVAKIYAASGGTVNGAAVDAAFSALTGIKPIICISTATDTWICS